MGDEHRLHTLPAPHCGCPQCHHLAGEVRRLTGERSQMFHEVRAVAQQVGALTAERDALQRFKTWVHDYLDANGVPHHPPGCHGAEGCRIGDRMDWLVGRLRAAEGVAVALAPFEAAARSCGERTDWPESQPWLSGSGIPITRGDCTRATAALAVVAGKR